MKFIKNALHNASSVKMKANVIFVLIIQWLFLMANVNVDKILYLIIYKNSV
jgi:hypothetical protein